MNKETVIMTFIILVMSFILLIIFGLTNFLHFHKKKYNFLGNFPFELHSEYGMKINNYIRSLILLFVLSSIFYQIAIFSSVNIISHTVTIVFGSLCTLSIGMMFFVNLNNTKLHLLSVTLSLTLSILSFISLVYLGLKTPLFIENEMVLYILCGVFIVGQFSLIFFPQMKTWMNFKEVISDDGTVFYERGKYNFLSSLEWIIIFSHITYLLISFIFIIPSFYI